MKYSDRVLNIALTVIFVLILIGGCRKSDNYNDIISQDRTKPDPITNVTVHNLSGSAYITYDLPKSENLLYVLAQYSSNDSTTRETKVSFYTDTLKVEGFDRSRDYEVTLYAVSRSEVRSDPVVVTVHPDEPAYLRAFPTISINPGFGGANISVINSLELPIGVVVISHDDDGKLVNVRQVNSDHQMISIDLRGYDDSEREFGVFITDPWGNRSDTLFKAVTPVYEVELDKSKFVDFSFSSDAKPYNASWVLKNLWDGDLSKGYHTTIPTAMPTTCTFGLGISTKLSRFKMWHRGGEFIGAFGNPKRFAMWGSNNPQDNLLPNDVSGLAVGDQVGSWIFMGLFVSPDKPSGLPDGQNTAEDIAWNDAGLEFSFESTLPAIEYMRIQGFESYSQGDFIHIMEISIWGQ